MGLNIIDPKNAGKLREIINEDPEFKQASRYVSLNLAVGYGNDLRIVQIHDGQVVKFEPFDFKYGYADVTIKCTNEFWQKFLQPIPPTYFHNIYAGMVAGQVQITGCDELFNAHFWPIYRLFDLMRINHAN